MSNSDHDHSIPRPLLIGAALLVLITIISAATGSMTGVGTTMTPASEVVQARSLLFADRTDGGVDVTDAASGTSVYVVPPGTNGFLRGVLRGMSRTRKLENVGPEPAYTLTRWADGRLSLADPSTGREVNLEPFGPTNYRVFAKFLDHAVVAQSGQ